MTGEELDQAYRLSNGEPICVAIYCNEPSHNGQRYDVYQFAIDEVGPVHSWAGGTRRLGKGRLRGASSARAILVGDRYVSQEERDIDKALIHREPIRTRYAFECDICGLNVVIQRIPLYAVLNGLALAGVSEISLRGLAAIVGK